ncbi:LysR family transcriptional regulator [Paraburkholderia sp.]|uniref:LysR family transcriptional regulator n=1 Tax=Paraburkholderia sp. TaxID=1926495 RepID=UPI002D2E812C|nr:LysR family transcriptional regulator [Paraburkholderia sp.]HZZ02705.1 LysR family transcriptional regulator [Paraburkholderia sp.]
MSPVEPAALLNDRIDWNLLRTFLAIVEERSISHAAARLHLTQSAVSQALKRLEGHLERRLIQRHGTVFEVTPAGEDVREIAEQMYGSMSRLGPALVARSDEVAGSVRFLTASRIHSGAYDSFLGEFHRSFPLVELHIEVMKSADIISALLARTATAGLGLCPSSMKRLEKRLFLRQRYAMFCGRGHRLFGRTDAQIADLLGENFVSFTSDLIGGGLSPLTIFRDQNGFSGRIVASSSNHDEVRRLIFAGFGIGYLPDHSVLQDISEGRLWRLPPSEGVADIDLHLLWSPEKLMSSAESTFLESFHRYADRFTLSERLSVGINP